MKPYIQTIHQEPFRMADFKEGIAAYGGVSIDTMTEERQFLTRKYGILDGSWYGFMG